MPRFPTQIDGPAPENFDHPSTFPPTSIRGDFGRPSFLGSMSHFHYRQSYTIGENLQHEMRQNLIRLRHRRFPPSRRFGDGHVS